MLQTFFSSYFPSLLIAFGILLIVTKQIAFFTSRKKPLSPKVKSFFWFLQAIGFWSVVIGAWIIGEAMIPDLISGEDLDDF